MFEELIKYLMSIAIAEGIVNENELSRQLLSGKLDEKIKTFIQRLFLGHEVKVYEEKIIDLLQYFASNPLDKAYEFLEKYSSKPYEIISDIIKILENYTNTLARDSITALEVLRSGNYKLFSELYLMPNICSTIEIGCRAKAPARLYDIERTKYSIIIRSDCLPISRLLNFILGDVARFIPITRELGRNGLYEVAAIPKLLLKSNIIETLKNIYLKLIPRSSISSLDSRNLTTYLEKISSPVTEVIISSPCLNMRGAKILNDILKELMNHRPWIYVVHRGCSPTDIMCGFSKKLWLSCIELEERLIDLGVDICTSQDIVETNIVINRSMIISGTGDLLSGEQFTMYIIVDKSHAEEVANKLLRPCICSPALIQNPIYFEY